jgi:hypothetical protein
MDADEHSQNNIAFFDELVEKLKLDRPIIVTASISHRYSVGWLHAHNMVS